MSLINRPDGVQFVVQPYRERIALGKRGVMVQRIRLLSEQHGQYILLSPLGDNAIEAVFSKESGYLLGETIWTYFQKPAYLIFCERLSKDNNQVLLVVIRANEVYLDMIVDNDKLRSELLPLMAMHESFRVITCGEVTLAQVDSPGRFVLPKNLVAAFETVNDPVFKNLPKLESAQLMTLLLTLKSPLLGSRVPSTAIAVLGAALLAILAWIYVIHPPFHPKAAPKKIVVQQPDINYVDYYAAMKTPTPEQQLNELAQTIQMFYGLPGWQPNDIHYDGSQYRVQMNRQGGTLKWLMGWATGQHYSLNLSSKGAEVAVFSQLQNRPRPKTLYPLGQVLALLVDQLDLLFPDQSITIGDPKIWGLTKSRSITINFSNASPDTLVLIGDTLGEKLPLSIAAIDVNVRNGLLNGNVQLSVWGI
ncbi:MAG: hypothetical protein JSR33_00330 [Proteobacteria bacterium]|nr:hypothetical protein [Pseudomonadota bacterium]